MSQQTSMAFYNKNIHALRQLGVPAAVREELESILLRLKNAADQIGDFQRRCPELDLVSAGDHRCPHCGSRLQNVGWNKCPACHGDVAWSFTRPLKFAGYTNAAGFTYSETLSGPCLPGMKGKLDRYYALRAVTAELEREFIVLKEQHVKKNRLKENRLKAVAFIIIIVAIVVGLYVASRS